MNEQAKKKNEQPQITNTKTIISLNIEGMLKKKKKKINNKILPKLLNLKYNHPSASKFKFLKLYVVFVCISVEPPRNTTEVKD